MPEADYSVENYVSDIRTILAEESDPEIIADRVSPLARHLATNTGWLNPEHRSCDEAQGYGVHLLHEEANHDLAVFVLSWLPDRGTMPHNHKTWAVVAGIEGKEHEVEWKRLDDGSQSGHAELEKRRELTMGAGDVTVCMPESIHSVWNTGDKLSLSLHTYGRHINFTGRSEFDPDTNLERPFVVTVED